MNFLAIFPEELQSESLIVLKGARAQHLVNTRTIMVGAECAAVIVGQGQAMLEVTAIDLTLWSVSLQRKRSGGSLAALPCVAIVAVPRPQILKRVLLNAAMFGVSELHLIRSENVEKSYLQSKCLSDEAIREQLIYGVEQSGSCHLPRVQIHSLFNPFIDFFRELEKSEDEPLCKWIAHTQRAATPRGSLRSTVPEQQCSKVAIAIGPEAGWNDYELSTFRNLGFVQVHAGPRILRVDTAFVYYLSLITNWRHG